MTITNINDAFPSKWIRGEDLQGRQVRVIIDDVAMETIGDDNKPVVYFRGKSKGLVLNKTNSNRISDLLGSADPRTWRGKEIWLHTERTDFQGKRVDAVRVMENAPVASAAAPAPAPQPAQQSENPAPLPLPQHPKNQIARPQMSEMNDEIPF